MDLFSVADDYGAWDVLRSAEKKIGGTFGGLCPLIGCICFFTDFVRRRNSTTQIVYLTSADFFFGGTFGGLCPLIACIFFNGLWFFFFGGTPLHKLCTWHLLIFFSAELSIQTYGSAELNITKCIVASADWMVFPRISADFFFSAELNITKCAPEFCWFVWIFGGSS